MIGIETDNGIKSVYCHSDGYIEAGVGDMLKTHYNDASLAANLVLICHSPTPLYQSDIRQVYGEYVLANKLIPESISSLGATINETRFNVDCAPLNLNFPNESDFIQYGKDVMAEYCYFFKTGKWFVYDRYNNPQFVEF